jgi:protein angel
MSRRSRLATAAELSPCPTRDHVDFTIATYNVLTRCDAKPHRDITYRNCCDEFLSWSYRRRLVLDQLDNSRPDVVCLQAIETSAFDAFYWPALVERGYDGRYTRQTEGIATFYRRDKFVCLATVPVESEMQRTGAPERDQVGLILVLVPQNSTRREGGRLVVANTHLIDHNHVDVRLARLAILLATIDLVAGVMTVDSEHRHPSVAYDPIILCGDFNSDPSSALFRFATENKIVCTGLPVSVRGDDDSNDASRTRTGRQVAAFAPVGAGIGITDHCQFSSVVDQRRRQFRQLYGDQPLFRNEALNPCLDEMSNDARDTSANKQRVITHPFHLKSSHVYTGSSVTTRAGASEGRRVSNYIFYSGGETDQLRLNRALSLPNNGQFSPLGGLQNKCDTSDRIMTMARFRLKVC